MFRHVCILLVVVGLIHTSFAQNINVSKGLIFDGEPCMAVSPANPEHLVVAWMGYTPGSPLGIKTIVSLTGGRSWSSPVFLPHYSPSFHSADPALAFDSAGNLFASYIDYRETPDSGGIYVVKSTDGGFTWNVLSKALDMYADGSKRPVDRPWLVINPVSSHLCITSKPAPWVATPNRPYFVASTDHGASWTPWKYIDGAGFLVGNIIKAPMAAPAMSSAGTFHCLYPSWVASQNLLPGYIDAKSTDNGSSFTFHGAVYATTGVTDTLAKAGGHLAADPANPNHLAFVFLGEKYGDLDVFLIESWNDGTTWSAPYRVNTDPAGNGMMQDLVWSDFNAGGDFVVAWRDRRNSGGSGYAAASEIWGALRWKDSTAFSANFRISDTLSAYQPVLGLNGNDFMTLAVSGDTLHTAWGDVRSGILNIWYSRIDLHNLYSSGIRNIAHEKIPEISIFPNPGGAVFYFRGTRVYEVTVYDDHGKLLWERKSATAINQADLSGQAPGTYLLYLKTEDGNVTEKVIKE